MTNVKTFIKQTLGCDCPEEVFEHIECRTDVELGGGVRLDYEINVGNRLLVFVVKTNEPALSKPLLSRIVRAGIGKRDASGFNRFRLVLLAEKPQRLSATASRLFQSLGVDEKVHLHVMGEDAIAMLSDTSAPAS